ILARFRRERRTLARLQHPNIARLIDSGTTSQGLPYIVMEYVDGLRITDHVRERKLGIDARIILFLSICSAVDFAHRNFVIHRDIKPGNILVDPEDTPKLLDFGICKLLTDPLSDINTVDTLNADTVDGILMTPSYASPEQARGEAITLLSDVYSLGVVLYELLTDKCFAKLNPHHHPRAVVHVTVPLASAAADDRVLKRRLSGDLDNILMRALEAEPHRRYESASLLADDLRRHLIGQPVLARPQTLPYRAKKFLRRNRGKVTAMAAFIALAGLLIVSWRGINRAPLTHVAARVADYAEGERHDALSSFRDSTAEVKEVIASGPHSTFLSTQLYRAVASQQLGDRLHQRGEFAEANQAYAESASIAESNLKSREAAF